MTEGNLLSGCLSNFEELSSTNHDIEQIKNIDNLLKCGICYEYFTTCVVTDCSHNFCSLCIRKYIQYKTECPVCFQQLYDSQLRANRIVDNLVNIFPDLKDRIVRHLRTLKTLKPNCIYVSPTKKNDRSPHKTPIARKRIPKTPQNIVENTEQKESIISVAGSSQLTNPTAESNKVIIPKIFQSPVKKCSPKVENIAQKHVTCPVCLVDILERNINVHLDDCLNRDKSKLRIERNHSSQRKHLPKLVYGLMSLNVLRSKVKEYGLNTQGNFEVLKNRLQRYTSLYNAECDKTDPRPVQELIRLLEKEEKALSCQKSTKSIFNVSRDDLPKEKLNEQYLNENRDSFQKLVDCVKQRKESKAAKEDCLDGQDSEENHSLIHCEPTTSKSNFNISCSSDSDTKNWIEIEEHDVKLEPLIEVKVENLDETSVSNIEKLNEFEKSDGSNNEFSSFLQKPRRKSKRTLFRPTAYNSLDTDEDDKNLPSPRKIVESSDEMYSNHSDGTDSDDHSSSPVIKKENIKKRGKKEPRGKVLTKKKK